MRRFGSRSPRRRTVFTIRWTSLLGQCAAVLVAIFVFNVDIPLVLCVAIFAFGALLNIAIIPSGGIERRLTEKETILSLGASVVQLACLLYPTGGLSNPFAIFLISPAITAAMVLSLRGALAVCAMSALASLTLLWTRLPLRFMDGWTYIPPPQLEFWVFVALLTALAFIAFKLRRISADAFDMSAALAATQMALEQQQRISAIGAMAAAIAHELGTPLATIKLTAAELKRELKDNPEAAEDVALIAGQVERCRDILGGLSQIKSPEDAQISQAPIMTVLQEAAEPHQARRAKIYYRLNGAPAGPEDASPPQPEIPRRPEIIHGLRNLIQNASDFAASAVWIDVLVDEDRLAITIRDDGAGFAAEILDRMGEPFATTRGRGVETESDYVGMGLGVFIAKTLLERTGATLAFQNAGEPGRSKRRRARRDADPGVGDDGPSGAIVLVSWPREALPVYGPRGKASQSQRLTEDAGRSNTLQSPIEETG